MQALGGHWSGVLGVRLVFSLIVVFLLVRVTRRVPEEAFDKWLYRIPEVPATPEKDVPSGKSQTRDTKSGTNSNLKTSDEGNGEREAEV